MPRNNRSANTLRSAAVAGVLALAVTACGGSDDSTETTATVADSSADTTSPTSDSQVMDNETTAPGDDTETMDEETTAPGDDTETMDEETTAPSDDKASTDGKATIDGATLWTSSDGKMSMEIDPSWTDTTGNGLTSAAWAVGTTGAAAGAFDDVSANMSPEEYLDFSAKGLEQIGTYTVIDSGVRKGPNGKDVGYMDYTIEAKATPGNVIHIMAFFNVDNGHTAVASFTAPEADFDSMIADVQPYLETILAL